MHCIATRWDYLLLWNSRTVMRIIKFQLPIYTRVSRRHIYLSIYLSHCSHQKHLATSEAQTPPNSPVQNTALSRPPAKFGLPRNELCTTHFFSHLPDRFPLKTSLGLQGWLLFHGRAIKAPPVGRPSGLQGKPYRWRPLQPFIADWTVGTLDALDGPIGREPYSPALPSD